MNVSRSHHLPADHDARFARAIIVVGVICLFVYLCSGGGALSAADPAGNPHGQAVPPLSSGDAVRGRTAFLDLKCHGCHRVAEDKTLPRVEDAWDGPVLRGFGKQSPEAVGWKIVTQTELSEEAVFDSPMAEPAAAMTPRQLVDLIAYLRNPAAGARGKAVRKE